MGNLKLITLGSERVKTQKYVKLYILFRQRTLKRIQVERPFVGNIWEYPLPPAYARQSSEGNYEGCMASPWVRNRRKGNSEGLWYLTVTNFCYPFNVEKLPCVIVNT